MLDKIIELDKQLLIFINNSGTNRYDWYWLHVTNPLCWIPFFLVLLYLVYKKLGTKQTLILLLFVAVLITVTDQTCNLFKHHFQRLRPCNDPTINSLLTVLKPSSSYSFFSGHSANSMAVSIFLFLLLKKNYKYIGIIFIWPILFAYSRMYLGLHFPTDVLCGYICGLIYGVSTYKLYQTYCKRKSLNLQNPTHR